jgi:hypothetical protein
MIPTHWPIIAHHDSQPLAQHSSPLFTATSSTWHTMIQNDWLRITHHDSQALAQHNTQWYTTCYAEPVIVNHVVLCWASGYVSWCAMLSQWLWIMVCYSEPVVVNHRVLCWPSGCESWWVMLSQWLWIVVCYAEPVVVYHGVLFLASDCESCCVFLSQRFTNTGSKYHTIIHNQWLSITHHDSHPLAHNSTPWFTTPGSA